MIETKPQIYSQSLTIGCGSIGPEEHIVRGEYGKDSVEALLNDIVYNPEVYQRIGLSIPVQCADGRTETLKGNSAIGGTFSLVVADALGGRRFYEPKLSAAQHAERVYSYFTDLGMAIGGHDDDHSKAPNSGCGGADKLDFGDPLNQGIIKFISDNGDRIRDFLAVIVDSRSGQNLNLGALVPNAVHNQIVSNAAQLHQRSIEANPYATNGIDLKAVMQKVGGANAIETLHGQHLEVAAVLDFRSNIALKRSVLSARHANKLQAFYVNVPSLEFGAGKLYPNDPAKTELTFLAAVYYNLAATAVLAHDSLKIAAL
jgi:hypothetical protein